MREFGGMLLFNAVVLLITYVTGITSYFEDLHVIAPTCIAIFGISGLFCLLAGSNGRS